MYHLVSLYSELKEGSEFSIQRSQVILRRIAYSVDGEQ